MKFPFLAHVMFSIDIKQMENWLNTCSSSSGSQTFFFIFQEKDYLHRTKVNRFKLKASVRQFHKYIKVHMGHVIFHRIPMLLICSREGYSAIACPCRW